MSDTKATMRSITVCYLHPGKSYAEKHISAAYHRKVDDLVEFKDADHRVVFAVDAGRLLSIEAANSTPAKSGDAAAVDAAWSAMNWPMVLEVLADDSESVEWRVKKILSQMADAGMTWTSSELDPSEV